MKANEHTDILNGDKADTYKLSDKTQLDPDFKSTNYEQQTEAI